MRRVRVLHRSRSFGREQRVAEHVRKELTEIIRSKMRDPRINANSVTLTEVRITRDMSVADVYVQCPDSSGPVDRVSLIEVLDNASGFLRTELAQRLATRSTPQLRFHYDDMEERAHQIDELIDQAITRETIADGVANE